MKKVLLITILLFTLLLAPSSTFVQGMMGNRTSSPSSLLSDDHTAQEEAEGREIWDKFQGKEITCDSLSDADFGALGEYFMGQSIGDTQRHALMNQMMSNMMGEEGEEQMHVAMGKMLSGCDPDAQVPQSGVGFMPMMWMMGSAGSPQVGGGVNPMMGNGGWSNMMGWNGLGLFGWIPMFLFWIILILGVIALLRYLGKSGQPGGGKTPLEILKERYARGDIDKKEYEQMKKDLA